MIRKIFSFSGMTIAAVALFFASGLVIGNQQAIAFGGYGYGHGFGHGFGYFYGPGLGHYYGPGFGPGYPVYNPCGGGPYSIISGQIVCTVG